MAAATDLHPPSLLASAFDLAPFFLVLLRGPLHVFELVNPAGYQLIGHRPVIGRPVREALPEMEAQGLVAPLDQVYATGEPFVGNDVTVMIQRHPGAPLETRCVSFVYQPLRDGDGSISGVMVHGMDVTAHATAAAALRQSEERFRTVLEGSPDGFMLFRSVRDEQGRIVDFVWDLTNPAGAALAEQSHEELVGRHLLRERPSTRDLGIFEAYVQVVESGVSWQRVVRWDADGAQRFFRTTAIRVGDGVGVTFSDVTPQVRAQESADRMAARMAAIASAAATTMTATTPEELRDALRDAAGRVLTFDGFGFGLLTTGADALQYLGEFDDGVYDPPRLVSLAGRPGEWVVRERRSLLGHTSADPAVQGAHLWGSGIPSESSIRTPILSGDRVLGMITVLSYTPHQYDERDVEVFEALAALAAGTLRNIALMQAERSSQEALGRSQEQLAQAQKMDAVGRLAGGIAHDFNNLLAVIKGTGELLLMDLARDDPMREDVEEITAAADRATALTRQLLAFSRKQRLEPRLLDANALVENLVGMLRRLIGAQVQLRLELASPLPMLLADPGQLEQVLTNLVVNARDAMPQGGEVRIATRLASDEELPEGTRPGEYVAISVADRGTGIPPEVLERIWEPFFTTKEAGKGTGLGLSTVYGIVQQSGGQIRVRSQPGQGSTFIAYLPVGGVPEE